MIKIVSKYEETLAENLRLKQENKSLRYRMNIIVGSIALAIVSIIFILTLRHIISLTKENEKL